MADEAAVEVISALVPATLRALNAIEFASRHLSPATLPQVVEALAGRTDDLGPALAASRALDWPGRLARCAIIWSARRSRRKKRLPA